MTPAPESQRRDYATAREAFELLNIRPQTLYAYVSRGAIRSIPQDRTRKRLYLRVDLERLRSRATARSGDGAAAATAMNFGEPIIPTTITEITSEGPCYRGRLACDLARSGASFESVAELLWTGRWQADPVPWPLIRPSAEKKRVSDWLTSMNANGRFLEILAMATLHLGIERGSVALRVQSGRTLDAARQIIQTLVGCFGLTSARRCYLPMEEGQTITQGLMRAIDIEPTDENREAIDSMLILLADHELPPGTLSARVAASSGGTLHSCIASGICASSGLEVARVYDRVERFLGHAKSKATLDKRASLLQDKGAAVPGFHHPVYPSGDPRARYLLELARRRKVQTPQLKAIFEFVGDMQERLHLFPRHEFAIVTLTRAMGLPPHVTGALFVLARVAGWVAHVQEQRLHGGLLRPRARFMQDGELQAG